MTLVHVDIVYHRYFTGEDMTTKKGEVAVCSQSKLSVVKKTTTLILQVRLLWQIIHQLCVGLPVVFIYFGCTCRLVTSSS